jgi:hypothetical protein
MSSWTRRSFLEKRRLGAAAWGKAVGKPSRFMAGVARIE